jgi:hypothetical protein
LHSSEGTTEQPLDAETARLIRTWRPPLLAHWLRQRNPGPPPVGRWESLLCAEQSLAQRVVPALARRPRLRRALRIPADIAEPAGPSLEEREKRLRSVRQTGVGRLLERLAPDPPGIPRPPRPDGSPSLSPTLAGEVDRALDLLRDVPFEEVQRRGWHLAPNNWLTPLNDVDFLRENHDLWLRPRWPDGIEFDLDGQEHLMRRLGAYALELADVPADGEMRPEDLIWDTNTFAFGDAYAYYGLVRELRPRRVVEIGAGHSSFVLARAVLANDDGTEVTLIEPYPDLPLLSVLPENWALVPKILQRAEFELFEQLEAGDILFYDGSHCVRTASDVNWMFFELLPRLKAGVWIHVHDIMWPWDYPVSWVLDNGLSWNEQYLVQAFLMHNDAFRLRLSSAALLHDRSEQLGPLFPSGMGGGSIWIEKTA